MLLPPKKYVEKTFPSRASHSRSMTREMPNIKDKAPPKSDMIVEN